MTTSKTEIQILYKGQWKNIEFNPVCLEIKFDLDRCEITFKELARLCNIQFNEKEPITSQYPKAVLVEQTNDGDDDEDVSIVKLTARDLFVCKTHKKYEFRPGKYVPVASVKEKCVFNNEDVELAAVLSDAVYQKNPLSYIHENYSTFHWFSTLKKHGCGLKLAHEGSLPYILAISQTNNREKTLWVALRGIANSDDLLTDMSTHPASTAYGMVHYGFRAHALNLPYTTLLKEYYSKTQESDDKIRLIFTGHSLGGSVAHICAMICLEEMCLQQNNPDIYSIAFGAPFVGNLKVAEELIKNKINGHFLTIINEYDIVPNLLNFVESALRLEATVGNLTEICKDILKIISPFIFSGGTSTTTDAPKVKGEELSVLISKTAALVHDKIVKYEPIGQYGFIRPSPPPLNPGVEGEPKWDIHFRINVMECDHEGNEKLIDRVSNWTTQICSPSSFLITDKNIINHSMTEYVSVLKLCAVITERISLCGSDDPLQIEALQRFGACIDNAKGIYSGIDVKLIIRGKNLDFVSSHKQMCVVTSPHFFKANAVVDIVHKHPEKLVLTSYLLPAEKRIACGLRKFTLLTHFGEIPFNLTLSEDTVECISCAYQTLNPDFFLGSLLRILFERLHYGSNLAIKDSNKTLFHFKQLFKHRLPSRLQQFEKLLDKYYKIYGGSKDQREGVQIAAELYDVMSNLLKELYEKLEITSHYGYKDTSSFARYLIPGVFTGGTAVTGLVSIILGVTRLPVLAVTTLAALASLIIAGKGLYDCSSKSISIFYEKHISDLLNAMGGSSDECANIWALEQRLCDELEKKSIQIEKIDIEKKEDILKIVGNHHLFNADGSKSSQEFESVLKTPEARVQAFKFLYDVYHISKIRKSTKTHYISFIGAHRAGKSSLLKSLWGIPAQQGDKMENRTQTVQIYTLHDEKHDKICLIDFPGVTDPLKSVAQLNRQYSVVSTFYVIVVRANTDYSAAAALIRELQPQKTQSPETATSDTTILLEQSDDEPRLYGLNPSAKFVVIITGIDALPDSLIQNELDEAANSRLGIDQELICLCYNEEGINDKNYVELHRKRDLPGISKVRNFLKNHVNKVFEGSSDFDTYKYVKQQPTE